MPNYHVSTILNHIDTTAILPRYEGFCMVYSSSGIKIINTVKHPYPTDIKKREILYHRNLVGIKKKKMLLVQNWYGLVVDWLSRIH